MLKALFAAALVAAAFSLAPAAADYKSTNDRQGMTMRHRQHIRMMRATNQHDMLTRRKKHRHEAGCIARALCEPEAARRLRRDLALQ